MSILARNDHEDVSKIKEALKDWMVKLFIFRDDDGYFVEELNQKQLDAKETEANLVASFEEHLDSSKKQIEDLLKTNEVITMAVDEVIQAIKEILPDENECVDLSLLSEAEVGDKVVA